MGHIAAFLTLGVLAQNHWPSEWEDRERSQLFAGKRTLKGGSSNSNAACPDFVADHELVLSGHLLLITALQGSAVL